MSSSSAELHKLIRIHVHLDISHVSGKLIISCHLEDSQKRKVIELTTSNYGILVNCC